MGMIIVEKTRIIPRKNYVILIVLSLATCFILAYFVRWYRLREAELQPDSIVTQVITEMNVNELDSYLLENPNIFVYISNPQNEETQSFEKEFENYLKEKEMQHRMIYIDISNMSDKEMQDFQSKWLDSEQMIEPNIIVIENGQKKEQLYHVSTTITMEDVQNLIVRYEVGE